jgi:4-oxalocrotonate tautomerase
MPFVQIHAIKDVFSNDQKRELLEKITDAMVSVEGEKMRGVTWVTFSEVESGDWAIGGQCLTTGDVQRIQKG